MWTLGFILFGTFFASWPGCLFPSPGQKMLLFLQIPFLLFSLFSFWDPIMPTSVCLMLCQKSPEVPSSILVCKTPFAADLGWFPATCAPGRCALCFAAGCFCFFSFRVLELWALSVLIVSVSLSLDKVLRVLIHSSDYGDWGSPDSHSELSQVDGLSVSFSYFSWGLFCSFA